MLTPLVFIVFAILGLLIDLGRAPHVILEWVDNPIIAGVMGVVTMFVLVGLWEPLFISNAASTPGKWIMGIRVLRNDGSKLSWPRAVSRFLGVWFIGMGAGVPLLSFIAMVVARGRLISEGVSAWDANLDCKVEHRKRHPFVWGLMVVLVVGGNLVLQVINRLPG